MRASLQTADPAVEIPHPYLRDQAVLLNDQLKEVYKGVSTYLWLGSEQRIENQ
jgi:hypothetical protein